MPIGKVIDTEEKAAELAGLELAPLAFLTAPLLLDPLELALSGLDPVAGHLAGLNVGEKLGLQLAEDLGVADLVS